MGIKNRNIYRKKPEKLPKKITEMILTFYLTLENLDFDALGSGFDWLTTLTSFPRSVFGHEKPEVLPKMVPKRPTSKKTERGVDVRSDVKTNVEAFDARMF